MEELNDRQKRFCLEYVVDLNATAAYRRAGYTTKNDRVAGASAARLLADVRVQEYIQQLKRECAERTGVTAASVLEEIRRVAFAAITDVIEFDDSGITFKDSKKLPREVTAAIASISYSESEKGGIKKMVKMHDKLGALQKLAEHLGLLKPELNVSTSGPLININYGQTQANEGTDESEEI